MNLTYEVPVSVQRACVRTLALHKAEPLQDVHGRVIAEALASGRVSVDVVAQMHRFFTVNARGQANEQHMMRSEHDSSLVRSWLMHGAEAGQKWSEGVYKAAQKEGYQPVDQIVELFALQPEDLYQRFSVGAWRWEYGLNPTKAARFLEEYHKATGLNVDLRQAFGDSAGAVGNALHRRFHAPDPFREAARMLECRDTDIRLAAELDLQEMLRGLDTAPVSEALAPGVWKGQGSDLMTAKLVWAPFVAYLILASEKPSLLTSMNQESKIPPAPHHKAPSYTLYHDATNTYLTWFHKDGARFVDPDGTKFDNIGELIHDLLIKAHYGKLILPATVQKVLGMARRWTAQNKQAGSLFHVFIADWRKANWQHILDNISMDADVRLAFQEFVGSNPMPAGGLKLQQTLVGAKPKAAVFAFLKSEGVTETGATALIPRKVRETKFGKAAAAAKTPVGIYAVGHGAQGQGPTWTFMGSYVGVAGIVQVFVNPKKAGDFVLWDDAELAGLVKSGKFVITQAHSDMPGSVYGGVSSTEAPKAPEQATAQGLPPAFVEWFKKSPLTAKEVKDSLAAFKVKNSQLYKKASAKGFHVDPFPEHWVSGGKGSSSGTEYSYVATYSYYDEDVRYLAHVWTSPSSSTEFVVTNDALVGDLVEAGEFVPVSSVPEEPALADPFGGDVTPPPVVQPDAEPEPLPSAVFDVGDVISWHGEPYLVHSTLPKSGPESYALMDLSISGHGKTTFPAWYSVLPGDAKSVGQGVSTPAQIAEHLKVSNSYTIPIWDGGEVPDTIHPDYRTLREGGKTPDGSVFLRFYYSVESDEYVALVAEAQDTVVNSVPVDFWFFTMLDLPPFEVVAVKSSYSAPAKVDAPSGMEDHVDPQMGSFEKCGSQKALDWTINRGWAPAYSSEGLFIWGHGEVHAYGTSKTRTIAGYAISDKGVAVYVIITEAGNMNWVSTVNAHKKYGGPVGSDDEVLTTLVSKPGEEAPKFPRVNYAVSDAVKAIVLAHGHTLVNPPSSRIHHVGTNLIPIGIQNSAYSRTLGAWVTTANFPDEVKGLLIDLGSLSTPKTHQLNMAETVAGEWEVLYETKTEFDYDTGELTIGQADDVMTSLTLLGEPSFVTLPIVDLPEGWDDPAPVEEPALGVLPSPDTRVAAGIIVIMPGFTAQMPGGPASQPEASFVLTKPMGQFMGYEYLFPKGTVDEGESMIHAAVREVREETGLTVKPVAYLGDYKGQQAVTRMYVGYVTGGDVKHKKLPAETDGLLFARLGTFTDSKWWNKLIPEGGSTKWQQAVVKDATAWVIENGTPDKFMNVPADHPAAVTLPGDVDAGMAVTDPFTDPAGAPEPVPVPVDEETGQVTSQWKKPKDGAWKPTIPGSALYEGDVWKALLFKSPFPVTPTMVQALKVKANTVAATPTSFDASRTRAEGVQYAQAFETTAGTPLTASGYVSWLGEDGVAYHFLLAVTPGGSVEVLESKADGYEAHVLSDQSLVNAQTDAWFEHPDPVTNKSLQKIFLSGNPKAEGVTMQTLKVKWLKAAGVPSYAVVTTNLLKDVCSMFVPGACSQFQHDAIISSLKARMQSTHANKTKKKGQGPTLVKSSAATSYPSVPGAFSAPAAPQVKKAIPTGVFSPVHTQYVTNPQPHLFKSAGVATAKGQNPNMLLNGPGGTQWFGKWAVGADEGFRVEIDRAASIVQERVLPKGMVIPVGVMDFEGKRISFQPYAADATMPPPVAELSPENIALVLAQHAYDMWAGDHDGHPGNWLVVSGKVVAIDRGQSFKYLLRGLPESLDPKWMPDGKGGDPKYAKQILLNWQVKKMEIPAAAWSGMLTVIRNCAAIGSSDMAVTLAPVFESLKMSPVKQKDVLAKLAKRSASYEKDWTKVLKKLRTDFKWPTVAPAKKPKAFQSSPAEMNFGAREEQTIADAVASGWKGKSIKVDKDGIEGQEVMCRSVVWKTASGPVPSTLLHWRVARTAGVTASKKLAAAKGTEFNEDIGGPQRLKADKTGGYWEKVWFGIRTINYHLNSPKDTDFNQQKLNGALDLVPELTKMTEATVSPGEYAPTHEPNEAVFAMAEQYLQYINIIQYWADNALELMGTHSPTFAEFLWEDPPEDTPEKEDAGPGYKVHAKLGGATWPKCVVSSGKIHIDNLNKPQYNSSLQSQFVIQDKLTGAQIYWNPPGDVGVTGIKKGVESQKGQAWAVIPGDPSAATVAHVMKLFQSASGIDMSASTAEDTEALYWSRQTAALQNNGAPKPDSHSETVVEQDYKTAMAKYRGGDAKGAITDMKKIVAKKLGKTVKAVTALSKGGIEGSYDSDGAGFVRQMRIGWDRAKLVKHMGPKCHVAHHISGTAVVFFKAILSNGALLSNAIKPFYGVTKTGASPGADMDAGGGQGLFCCFRKGFSSGGGMIYFDISLALRLDVYVVGTGDTFGKTTMQRYMTPEQWTSMGAHLSTGTTGSSSPMQVNIRHDIDLRQYLVRAVVGHDKATLIKMANDAGWTFYGGLKPEEVFV